VIALLDVSELKLKLKLFEDRITEDGHANLDTRAVPYSLCFSPLHTPIVYCARVDVLI